ncbi:alpha-glucosidase [Lacticaseibacillus sp. 866-1]|uniref:glycoside hydrolase family 13 protein n=1 Tax=Lacticaseibacillus sp. 866-1 TaxID=2799576 RepID=UPI00194092A8|nr:alpha-glucosidase [Lacticaseibacillus sp. 866-1]
MAKAWWKEAVVYQVYPRSFQDSNGDGIGDLRGIRDRLDYIKQLGATVIWLNPIYASPNDDNGYDISDYQAIQPDFGTMAEFDQLLEAAHARGLKIVMDLVVNHTSDEHHWFIESRKSKDNPYSDYYLWADPVDGHAPNDWESSFSGSAWQYAPERQQYYLHLFSKKQPDLNWREPAVRHSVYDLMRFWLDKGIDGFRMDVINFIGKPKTFDNDAPSPINLPQVQDYLKEMNREVLSHYDVMTVGEMPGTTPALAREYTGFDTHELNMIFQFQHTGVDLDQKFGKWVHHPFKLTTLKKIMDRWQVGLDGKAWNSLYWNNHDQPRVVSRFGNDSPEFRERSAKMLGAVLHYQQGTPYIYQGEELGMTNNAGFTKLSDYRDIESLNGYREWVDEKGELTPEQMLAGLQVASRDNARTPMQWGTKPNAGFCPAGVTPWIMVNPNYVTINADQEVRDQNSVFNFYRQMNLLRAANPIITYGDFTPLAEDDEEVWAYQRHYEGQTLTLVANWTARDLKRACAATAGELLQSNYPDDLGETLRPYEVKVYLQ